MANTKVNISKMTYAEMCELREELNVAIEDRHEEERHAIAKHLEDIATSQGFSLSEIFGLNQKRKQYTVKPKYRNPYDSTQMWTGRGRKPRWVVEALENGSTLEDMQI